MVKATVETARREVGSLNLDTRNGRLGLGDTRREVGSLNLDTRNGRLGLGDTNSAR